MPRASATEWVLLATALATAATAQDNPSELPEVVVTATRTPTRADDVTSSVSVISGEEIERRGETTTAEALRGAPGLDVTQFGTEGRSAFAAIRGAAPDQVLVLLDGVEANSPTVGQFDFANLTTDNIDRIEVLRGGGGTLYGSEAIGGVINVVTRRGEGPLHVTASGEAGRAAAHREVLGVNGAQGPFALSGTTSFSAADGFQAVNDDYRNFSTVWRADADVLPSATVRGFVRYTTARAGLPNFNVVDSRLDPDAHSRSDFFLGKGEWEHALTGALTYRASASFLRDNERFHDEEMTAGGGAEPVVVARFPSEIIGADTQLDYRWRGFALSTVGGEFKERSARVFKLQRVDEASEEVETERFNANRSSVAVFGQQQLTFLEDTLRGVGGVRYDRIDRFGDVVTWSGSGSYLVRPTRTRFRLSYAEGFRAPTFDELFEPGLGNPNLQPERSREVDVGLTQELFDGRLRLEPTYFHRRVRNLIEEIADELPGPVAGIPEGTATRNLDARLDGVEIATRLRPLRWLTLWGTYTYLHFRTPTGTLLNRPHHRGTVSAVGERSDLLRAGDHASASVVVHAVGRRDSADPFDRRAPFSPRETGGYARTDLSFLYHVSGRLAPLTLFVTLRNLFDRDYSESIGFPAPPARFLVGFRYQY